MLPWILANLFVGWLFPMLGMIRIASSLNTWASIMLHVPPHMRQLRRRISNARLLLQISTRRQRAQAAAAAGSASGVELFALTAAFVALTYFVFEPVRCASRVIRGHCKGTQTPRLFSAQNRQRVSLRFAANTRSRLRTRQAVDGMPCGRMIEHRRPRLQMKNHEV